MADLPNLDQVPKPLLLGGVFVVGLLFFYLFQKPHTVCDSQVEQFHTSQNAVLFSQHKNNLNHAPLIEHAIESCKQGRASLGACDDYFHFLQNILLQMQSINSECGADLFKLAEAKKALTDGIVLMTQMAWGDIPPEQGVVSFGPLQTPELGLFCQLKDALVRYGKPEDWASVQTEALQKLPGEVPKYEVDSQGKRNCTNCESLKSAEKAFGREEALSRSLLRLRCDRVLN